MTLNDLERRNGHYSVSFHRKQFVTLMCTISAWPLILFTEVMDVLLKYSSSYLSKTHSSLTGVSHEQSSDTFSVTRSEHILTHFHDVYWLQILQHIRLCFCVPKCHCLNNTASLYLAESIQSIIQLTLKDRSCHLPPSDTTSIVTPTQ